MRRFLPRSLLGQVMLVLALGLMAAQAISGIMLYRAAEERREAALVGTLAFRLAMAGEDGGSPQARAFRERIFEERRQARFGDGVDPPPRRRLRIGAERSDTSPLGEGEERLGAYEDALRSALARQDIAVGDIVVTRRLAGADPFLASRPHIHDRLAGAHWAKRYILVAGAQRADSGWTVVRVAEPRRPRSVVGTIILQTVVIFAVLFALLYLVLRRLTRPLERLTRRVGDFASSPDRAVMIEESGPSDMRRLIAAHNAMEARIAAMLDEKDVMLGAIGHDLKTPLAALRVRTESVPDEAQRSRMVDSIEDITRTLDDILNLARVGRASDPLEPTDLAAMVASLVEEYEDMGEPVELRIHRKVVVPLRATWLRRAVRNLIGNALRYGETAKVDVEGEGDMAVIRIEDEGPGIHESQIAEMMEPFRRGETSRNRATGGAGLGLTLARAIVEQHGGTLTLSNRNEGGLHAEIRIPV